MKQLKMIIDKIEKIHVAMWEKILDIVINAFKALIPFAMAVGGLFIIALYYGVIILFIKFVWNLF